MNKKAFTLVELIVVITILAVLATVAFVSFQWYAMSARDSARLSDLKSMTKVLELYNVRNGKYSYPDMKTNVTYSWTTAWSQWVFWKSSFSDFSSMSNIPVDPVTWLEYPYSITSSRQEYQIAAVLENVSASNILSNTYAWDQLAQVYIKWNYNGKFLKVRKNTTTYLLWVPSILASDIISSTALEDIITNKKLVYEGHKNLPASFSGSVYNIEGWFDFGWVPYVADRIVLFEWETSELETNPTARAQFFERLQASYSWSVISWESSISELLSINWSSSQVANNYVATTLNNTLKTNIPLVAVDCNNLKWQYRTSYAFNKNNTLPSFINSTYAMAWPEYLPDLDLCDNRTIEFGVELTGLSASNGNREVIKLELEYWYEYNITVTTDDDLGHLIYNSNWEIMQSNSFYNIWNIKFTPPKSWIYYVWLLDPYWTGWNNEEEFWFLDLFFSKTYAEGWGWLYDYLIVKNNSLTRCELWETRDNDSWACEAPISWSCNWIITNAVYSNWNSSKNIVNATHYSSLTAKYNKVPLSNSCEYKCQEYYTYKYWEPLPECRAPISWTCTGIIPNAEYYDWNTSYTLNNAPYNTSLIANFKWSLTANTCEFKCNTWYWFDGTDCIHWLDTIIFDWDPVVINSINVVDSPYLISNHGFGFVWFKVNLDADVTHRFNVTANSLFEIDSVIIYDNNKNELHNYYIGDENFMFRTEITGNYYVLLDLFSPILWPGQVQDYNFDINTTNDPYIPPSEGGGEEEWEEEF